MTTLTQDYTLGEPQVAGPLAVYPVFGPPATLRYRAFVQAADFGAFVKELDSGAVVGTLSVENPTDLPLLVYEGEEVLGAQQNRTFDASVLVPAGERLELLVSCVEQGRWDRSRYNEAFRPIPQAADPSMRRTKRAAAERLGRPDQGEVWAEIAGRLADHGVDSTSAAMSDVYDHRRGELEKIVGVVRHLDGQIGAVALVSSRPTALDLVSRADVFAALLPALARGYALDALGAPEQSPDQELAEDFLRAALAAPRVERPTPGVGRGRRRWSASADRRGARARRRAGPALRVPGCRCREFGWDAPSAHRPSLTAPALARIDANSLFSTNFMDNALQCSPMRSVDVHQHLWPEGVLAVLEKRSAAPKARWRDGRWRVDLEGEPSFEIDPADHEPDQRAQHLGVDRALLALSSPVGTEALPPRDALAVVAAWHEAAAALPAELGWWSATPAALAGDEEANIAREAISDGAAGVCLPANRLATPRAAEQALPLLEAVADSGAPLFVHPGVATGRQSEPAWWCPSTDYVAQQHAAWHAFHHAVRPHVPNCG